MLHFVGCQDDIIDIYDLIYGKSSRNAGLALDLHANISSRNKLLYRESTINNLKSKYICLLKLHRLLEQADINKYYGYDRNKNFGNDIFLHSVQESVNYQLTELRC